LGQSLYRYCGQSSTGGFIDDQTDLQPVATWATASAAISGLVAYLLEFLPLVGRQHLLQTFIGLPPDVIHTRLRLATQCAQLLAGVAKDLLDLRLLICIQLQTL
jgi:hypothetical protein